jgi:polar amino acid transport system permease protein
MKYGLQFRDVFAAWEFLLEGLAVTLALSVCTMVLGFFLGLACAYARTYGGARFKQAVTVYIETIRNTPLLVQIFLLYFGLPSLGLRLEGFDAALIALVINLGAYSTEIIRAGLEAIPKSQIEAGQSLGLTPWQIFRYIIVFPALKAMYPALSSQFILLMLATSVVSQISVQDLFLVGSIIQSRTFRDFEVYTVIGCIYLALAFMMRGVFAVIYRQVFAR